MSAKKEYVRHPGFDRDAQGVKQNIEVNQK